MTNEEILNYVKKHGELKSFHLSNIADLLNVNRCRIVDIIAQINNVHERIKLGKKLNPKSVKYLDFIASNPKDDSKPCFIKYIGKNELL
jgi:predicted DNA-binding protein YlxM (UPF0122 family)